MTLTSFEYPQTRGSPPVLYSSTKPVLWPNLTRRFLRPFSFTRALLTCPHAGQKLFALKGVVSELKKWYGEVKLDKDELEALRRHFKLMPLNYIRAGYSADLILQHIALSQQSREKRKPAVLVREHPSRCSDRTHRTFDFFCNWRTHDGDHAESAVFQVHVYFPSSVTESTIRKAFELAFVPVISLSTFNCNGGTLLVALVNCSGEDGLYTSFEVKSIRAFGERSNSLSFDEVEAKEGIVDSVSRLHDLFEVLTSCASPNSSTMAVDSSNGTLVRILFDENHSVVSGKALLSKYLIDRKDLVIGESIGVGSSGEVYKGFFKGLKVAVKELKGMTKGSRTEGEFRREVLGLISCAHKNVLKLYGVCVDSKHGICIVTKFMEGGSLLQFLQQKRGLKIKEVLRRATDVAKGMEFLHSRGIVHMDLKTANVFLDEERNAVIGDLGVARLVTEKVETGEEIGTYRWMAPEVCGAGCGNAGSFSPKSDVYSFGILLWELITCQMPYSDYNPVQAAVGVVMHSLRPVIPSDCFPPLRYLIEKCWDQNPSVRPHFSQIVEMLQIISKQDWS